MKPSDIQVGKTYCNRGKGRTRRIVLAFVGGGLLRYEQPGYVPVCCAISKFARWAEREVKG